MMSTAKPRAGTGAVLAALLFLFLAGYAEAQLLPAEIEGRLGAAFPLGEISQASPGISVGASVGYGVTPTVTLSGGYTHSRFGAVEGGTLTTGGFDLGARVALPAPLRPWLRGGAVFHRWRETGFADSDRSVGLEVGGGVVFQVAGRVALTPGLRYTTFSPRWRGEGLGHGRVDTLVIDLGARFAP